MNFELSIEVAFVGTELIFAFDAPFPPRLDEAATVAGELDKGCTDAQETNLRTGVLRGCIGEDEKCVEEEG